MLVLKLCEGRNRETDPMNLMLFTLSAINRDQYNIGSTRILPSSYYIMQYRDY